MSWFSAWARASGVIADIAAPRARTTWSSVVFSCAAYPLTVSTRFGTRSVRRLSWTSMSDQASPERWRSPMSRLYVVTAYKTTAAATARKITPPRVIASSRGSEIALDNEPLRRL